MNGVCKRVSLRSKRQLWRIENAVSYCSPNFLADTAATRYFRSYATTVVTNLAGGVPVLRAIVRCLPSCEMTALSVAAIFDPLRRMAVTVCESTFVKAIESPMGLLTVG